MFFGQIRKIICRDADADSLFDAVETGDLADVKRLVVGCGVDPNVREDEIGATPLHVAATYGYSEIVEFLLNHGADPNIREKYGCTPLHYATWFGNSKVVKVLLNHGADPNIRDKQGATPLHYAAAFDYPKIVEVLHKKGLSDYDITPLQAAEFNYPEVVKLLLEHGANPNIQENNFGWTPLHFAAKVCHVHVARVLLDYGADPTIRDNEGKTPLDYGSNCGEFIKELRRRSGGTMVYK
jgi:ankyrin repeat protein